MTANLFGPDVGYIVIIALIVLIGGSQLPKIARNAGLAGKEFRKAHQQNNDDAEQKESISPNAAAAAPPPVTGAPSAPPAGPDEPVIQLSPAQLDGLLKAREEEARRSG